jgi:hypothetical protein
MPGVILPGAPFFRKEPLSQVAFFDCDPVARERLEIVAKSRGIQGRICALNYGGRSSVGRAPDCGSGGRGFEPHRPPQISVGIGAENALIAARVAPTWKLTIRAISSIGRAVDS